MAKMEKKPKKGAPGWMVSFADLQQLLLVFFVLLFSFSALDAEKFQSIMNSFSGGSSVMTSGGVGTDNTIEPSPKQTKISSKDVAAKILAKNEQDSEKLKENVKNTLSSKGVEQEEMNKKLDIVATKDGIILRLKDGVLFDSGKADVKSNASVILESIGNSIKSLDREVRIEGHTDNVPMSSAQFKSNWELSTARAINVMRFFVDTQKISQDKFSVAGYGEFKPIAPNDTPQNKGLNRRVDIVLLNSENF